MDNVSDVSKTILELFSIQSSLDKQDELDRKSIALWGHKDRGKGLPNNLTKTGIMFDIIYSL